MDSRQLKTKITKILKANNFVKAETYAEWNHPRFKHAGFEYLEANKTYITYYIPNGVFTKQEQQKKINEKVQDIYSTLQEAGLGEHLRKWDYSIEFLV